MNERVTAECAACGKVFAVAASFAGKKIRCPQCQGIIQIAGAPATTPPTTRSGGSTASSRSQGASTGSRSETGARSEPRVARPVRSEEAPAPRTTRPAATRPPEKSEQTRSERPRPARRKRSENYDEETQWGDMGSHEDPYGDNDSNDPYSSPAAMPPRSRKGASGQKFRAETTPASSSGGSTDGSVLVGILMMVGAAVWFFGGLAFGYLFYYPPILFILGLITTIKGALNLGK